ncbi:MAG: c-type cytochrome [Flavobacteriales bacterium]|nr:c-type cytochrome [Flavobacteriales bacterium]
MNKRNLLSIATLALLGVPAVAQDAAAAATVATGSSTGINPNYLLLGAAILQVVIIISLNSVMRLLGGSGKVWTARMQRTSTAALVLLLFTGAQDAQAATGPTQWTSNQLFYVLIVVNVFLFILLLAQVNLLRNMTRTLVGKAEEEHATSAGAARVKRPTFESKLLQVLTRRVSMEREQDVLMHHEYDGIRELDNVLPPWWLWLFYGTIIWSVVYLVNVHVTGVWPHQADEYAQEMEQAKADVAAYVARLGESVDENNVKLLTDAGAIGTGKGLYEANCVACHGSAAEGKTGLGPNLTDAYWIHGGGIKNVFSTIKYGVPAKGMISWKTQMKASELQAVASYVLSLQGSEPANAQPPQGDLWKEEGAPAAAADSTAAPADSSATPADTASASGMAQAK